MAESTLKAKFCILSRSALDIFRHPWLAFHCIVVEKATVEKAYYSSDHDLAIHRNFNKLIEIKITIDIKVHLNRYFEFRIELNPLPSRYKYELPV